MKRKFNGIDEFTGNTYAFDLHNVEKYENFDGMGPAVSATIETDAGKIDIMEWCKDGKVCRNSPDSNIIVNFAPEVAALFAFDRPSLAPIEAFIPSALFDELQNLADE